MNLEQEAGSDPWPPLWTGGFILITGKAVKDFTGSDVTFSIKRPCRLNRGVWMGRREKELIIKYSATQFLMVAYYSILSMCLT